MSNSDAAASYIDLDAREHLRLCDDGNRNRRLKRHAAHDNANVYFVRASRYGSRCAGESIGGYGQRFICRYGVRPCRWTVRQAIRFRAWLFLRYASRRAAS